MPRCDRVVPARTNERAVCAAPTRALARSRRRRDTRRARVKIARPPRRRASVDPRGIERLRCRRVARTPRRSCLVAVRGSVGSSNASYCAHAARFTILAPRLRPRAPRRRPGRAAAPSVKHHRRRSGSRSSTCTQAGVEQLRPRRLRASSARSATSSPMRRPRDAHEATARPRQRRRSRRREPDACTARGHRPLDVGQQRHRSVEIASRGRTLRRERRRRLDELVELSPRSTRRRSRAPRRGSRCLRRARRA